MDGGRGLVFGLLMGFHEPKILFQLAGNPGEEISSIRIFQLVGVGDGLLEQFVIEGDGVELTRSQFMRPGMSEPMKIDVTGVKTLTLRAEGSEGHNHGCWSIWCDPLIERTAK